MLDSWIDAEVQSTLPDYVRAFIAHGHVVCDCGRSAQLCGGAEKSWQCETGKCDYFVLAAELPAKRRETRDEPPKAQETASVRQETAFVPLAQVAIGAPLTDDELLEELENACSFKVGAVPQAIAAQFARHLLDVAPVGAWTNAIAKNEWPKFQEQRKAAA